MASIKTTLHTYTFDTSTENGKTDYARLLERLAPRKPMVMGGGTAHTVGILDGREVELELAHVFDNQWNTAPIDGFGDKGLRVFDWYEDANHRDRWIKAGHYLDITPEMIAVRRDTFCCGYCGKQYPRAEGEALGFCSQCFDSEYLQEGDLYLTRLLPVAESGIGGSNRRALSKAERAKLVPRFIAAQTHGETERGKARIAAKRAKVADDFNKAVHAATAKRDGFTWLMDRGMNTDNVIYYAHTNRFSFGWRKPLGESEVASILEVISEFPFSYDLQCDNGRTLSGN